MKFPTYQSQAQISTQIAKVRKPQVDFTPLTRAAGELAQEWQRATDVTETNQAYNNIEQGTAEIMQRAEQDTDYRNRQKYIDEIEALRTTQQDVFSTKSTANRFQRVADSSANQSTVKINGMFRNKMIKHQQGEVVRSQSLNKQAFMGGDINAKEINKGILKENLDNGFISDIAYQKGIQDMNNWDMERAQQDVATNPEFVLNNIDNYGLDEVQKADIRKDAESLFKKNQELAIIKGLELENLSSSQLIDVVNSGVSDQEKTKSIQEQVLLGNISKEFAGKLGKLMVSEKAVNAVTNDAIMADIIQRTYDLNSMADVDPKAYLTGIQNIKDEIIIRQTRGELAQEDGDSLNRQLKTLTSGKTAESTSFISYNYGQAKDVFDTQLPPEYRAKAMRQLYYDVQNKDLTDAEYKEKSLLVVDKINQERRGLVLQRVEQPFKLEEQRDFLSEKGYTIEDVRETAKKYNLTEEQVISRIRGQ